MNERLKERINNYLSWLEDEYAEKPRRWWQGNGVRHLTTQSLTSTTWNENDPPEVIIKYNRKTALRNGAVFLLLIIGTIIWGDAENERRADEIFNLLMMVIVYFLLEHKKLLNNNPQILFCKEGFWIQESMHTVVEWEYLVAAYIIIDESGDGVTYQLEVHYYDESKDIITKAEKSLSGLDADYKKIAAYIEYWKK